MPPYVHIAGLQVDTTLHRFAVDEALPGSGVDPDAFWQGLAELVRTNAPRNQELLGRRVELQDLIDDWHRQHRALSTGMGEQADYVRFLADIGYLEAPGADFDVETEHVDVEIADVPGPQLVVPVSNARYALNAANARWGSLYDALYGTDALGDPPVSGPYDPERGRGVVRWVRRFLDDVVPLAAGSHADATGYAVADDDLEVTLAEGQRGGLATPGLFLGYAGDPAAPSAVVLRHHGLHIELVIDRTSAIGGADLAGVADVVIEAAVTTIMDCEDSVAAVDVADKVLVYRNWLGLMTGALVEDVPKPSGTITRRLNADRTFVDRSGGTLRLRGRALMLVRNVGHLMTTDAVLDADGNEVPEGLLDAMFTVLAAKHDLRREPAERNSACGSVYVVKPKMHGPAEVAFAVDVFAQVEQVLGLPENTVKIGLMDEERRTSANLEACIRAARSRLAFINTGFLDRTGDEIHTSFEAGAMQRKGDMKTEPWLNAYEQRNVSIGLACGLRGRAQIGKGMWAAPDLMAKMLAEKINHLTAGASCAWVPSPTAAVLHATHYHRVDVFEQQDRVADGPPASIEDLLTIPVVADAQWTAEERRREVENNAQGILGYVARWVDQGIGCSKVPDIDDVALMEDRATCRISSQHIANWLHHGVVAADQVRETMARMAVVVDRQNADDPWYTALAPNLDGPAFRAACELVFQGSEQPSGYTEPILHRFRREQKQMRLTATPSEAT
ncbi:MAG: malate synthase G [Actinomycetota bacterium]|nr:malate synthase G [Actinomycetota bacterium]